MKKILIAICLATIGALSTAQTHREGTILVAPKAGVSEQQFKKTLDLQNAKVKRKMTNINVFEINVPAKAEARIVKALQNHPNIKFAELDKLVQTDYVANDTYFNNAWHLSKMNIPAAWDITEGSGIIVSINDTGVNNHPDLVGQVLFDRGYDVVSGTNVVTDSYGHGSKVAGVAGAITNNGLGISSVMGKIKILPIKITGGTGNTAYFSDMAEGVTYAANNGARVANTSFGGAGSSSTIQSAAAYMVSKGGVVVWSAGNDNIDNGFYDNPNIIIVSATDINDNKASFSSFGAYVDVAAPGVGIYTTNNANGYVSVNGTSFSAPIVAATVAGMLSVNPSLVSSQVDRILKETAVDRGTVGEDVYFGHGRVDALAAIQRAIIEPAVDTQPPAVTIVSPTIGSSVLGVIDVTANAYDNIGVAKVDLNVNGVFYASETVAPYVFSLDTTKYKNGNLPLDVIATDQAGNTASTTLTVWVTNPDIEAPVITISGITDGATYRTGNLSIKVTVADLSPINQTLILNGVQVASSINNTINYRWSASKAPKGTYTFIATAKDSIGNVSSKTVIVTKI